MLGIRANIIKQANMDNCGDRLCGIPQTEDKLIDTTSKSHHIS